MQQAAVEKSVIELPQESFSRRTELATSEAAALVAAPSNAGSLLVAITRAASDPKIDMDKMERLWAMHQTMVAQEEKSACLGALSRAQSNIVPVVKRKWNEQTKSHFADLGDIVSMVTPIYSAEGLSLSFNTEVIAGHDRALKTVAHLGHAGGHIEIYELSLPLDDVGPQGNKNKTGVHATVSTISYARRVLTCMIFNIPLADNDGNVEKKKAVAADTAGKRGEGGLPAYAESNFNANLSAWTEMIQSGKKTADQIIKTVSCKAVLSAEQQKKIRAITANTKPGPVTCAQVDAKLKKAKSRDELDTAADLIKQVAAEEDREILTSLYEQRKTTFNR